MVGSVHTVFELLDSEEYEDAAFHTLDNHTLVRALSVLAKQGKVCLFRWGSIVAITVALLQLLTQVLTVAPLLCAVGGTDGGQRRRRGRCEVFERGPRIIAA